MKKELNEIKKPIAEEMVLFNKKLQAIMKSKTPLLDKIMNFIIKRKGKQIRPIFVFLTAKLSGKVQESTYRGASLVELLHTATLVHDDVVDEANQRRGFFSLNALWKNKISVLIGDYLLAKGLLLSLDNKDFQLLHIVSDAVRRMSEGELLQIEKARKLDITEEIYYQIISSKTASLIASCCAVGASSVGADEKDVELMRQFGENVGIAFQIKDDLLDLDKSKTGKPKAIDIKEKKMTLPLIYALNKAPKSEKRKIIRIIKKYNTDSKKVAYVIGFILESGGIQYAEKAMEKYRQNAFEILNQFPDNEYKKALKDLVDFTIVRQS